MTSPVISDNHASPLSPISDLVPRADLIAERIKTAILRGDLQPGEPLVERELALILGVSKTPIREALKILSTTGLVTVAPYRGTVVREPDRELAQSIYDVRMLLEPEATRRAVPFQSEASIRDARALLASARDAGLAGDFAALTLSNRRFHRLLYAPCGNPVLCAMLDEVQDQVSLIASSAWRIRTTWREEAEQHDAILDAVAAGRADDAADLLRTHIDESLARLLNLLPSVGLERPT